MLPAGVKLEARSSLLARLPGAVAGETNRSGVDPERVRETPPRGRQRRADLGRSQQQVRQLGGEICLFAPPIGLQTARARELGDEARRHCYDDEHDQRRPVPVVGEREPPAGR